MIKRILTATIVLSLVFILGCSEISDVTEDLAHTSSIKLAAGDKADSYSHVVYHMDNIRLTLASVNPIDPGASADETLTWTAQAGSHTIKAVVDSNNEKTIALSTLTPDLIIETITWSPENPSIRDTVTFTVTIKNQGSGSAGSSRVAYYIDDTYLTSDYVSPIDPGASADETFTWTAQAGSHAIKAVADSNDVVTESNETNNVKTYSLSTLAPDLIIETISWSPESPSKGDTVTFSVTVKNQGNDRAGSSRVYFYIDGSSRGYQEVQRIDAGATLTKTFAWTAQAGSHAIKAVADSNNVVTESDETNNEKTITFSTLAPDLLIEAITWLPANPSIGDNVTFTVTIKNQGSGKADYSRVAYYINDTYLTSATVNPIDPAASANRTFAWIARADSHAIKAVADSNNVVTESDETNNEKTITFSTLVPDLIIETITWSPESPSMGDNVTFTVTIKNQGSAKAGSSRVYFYIDGSSRGYQDVPEINAGATVTKAFAWIARADSHDIKAVADSNDKVTESDETNNEKTVTFSTLPPDLIIETITWSPANPSIGDTITFTVTIKNQGSGKADYSHVAYYIDDAYLSSASVSPIDAAASANETFTWTAQADSHAIKAVADSNDKVTESNETNNEKTVTFSTFDPDLIIETITGLPTSPPIGDTVTFTVTIKNQGSGKAGSSRVYFYIDGSSRGYQDVPEIDAGATVTKTFPWTAQTGSHAIKAVADSNDKVTESDETNNEKTVTFPIPDLIIETITWLPASPSQSDDVTFTVTIKNQGSDRAGSSRIYFYIDGSSRGYQDVPEIDAGATVTKALTWTAQAGSHAIKAVADSNNEVTESDETNNEKTVTFLTFASDLIIETITWSPTSPSQSDNVTFTITIKNQGSGKADYSYVAYYINDTYLTSASVNPIDPGASANETLTWTAQAGPHAIKAVADSNNKIIESNETNNEKTITLPVVPLPASTPSPTPSTKPEEAPAEKPAPVPSPERGIWPDLLFVLAAVVLGGTAIIVILRSRRRRL